MIWRIRLSTGGASMLPDPEYADYECDAATPADACARFNREVLSPGLSLYVAVEAAPAQRRSMSCALGFCMRCRDRECEHGCHQIGEVES